MTKESKEHNVAQVFADQLTIIIPAYNEAESIADTIASIKKQTVSVYDVVVVDDCSTDNTASIAGMAGSRVIRPEKNTGSKAGAQNYALSKVETLFTMALDADTTLAPDAIEKLIHVFTDENIKAACGFVIPRKIGTIWERGRYIEYLLAFTFYKPIQDYFGKPLISSGCFSIYRTKELKENNGWETRTMAEDMDLTWSFYIKKYGVRFVPEAVCYPIEPRNFSFMRKQLKRWSHGFAQNIILHWRQIIHIPYLRSAVAVAVWDSSVASLVYITALPILSIVFQNPIFLLGYIIDAPVLIIPVLVKARRLGQTRLAILSFPSFFFLRIVNCIFIIEAFWSEFILKKRLTVYEKGH